LKAAKDASAEIAKAKLAGEIMQPVRHTHGQPKKQAASTTVVCPL